MMTFCQKRSVYIIMIFSNELILGGKLQLRKLQKKKPEKILASMGLEPVPPRY